MDVDRSNFTKHLLPLLKQISRASFVTFDLEMSGINARPKHIATPADGRDPGKPTLQQQYQETKEAAETFQVLQLGITLLEEDHEREMYIARPYNFHLSPLFIHGDRLDIDRKFSFSSSACDFLLKNNFDFGKIFEKGIPYLSRHEEQDARERFVDRVNGSKRGDIIIQPSEPETLNFYRNARKTIGDWIQDSSKSKDKFVNIQNPDGPLNGYQRRLVHQLVTNEFPEYRAFTRHEKSFMQVEKLDQRKEAEFQRKKLADFNSMVAKQTGLRWIFEALCGGDLSTIDPWWFCEEKEDKAETQTQKKRFEAELREISRDLKGKKHILIGHNLFTDLIFLYKTFIGELPDQIREFQKSVHTLFPLVIDTKYLATHEQDSMNPREGLKALWEPFKMIHQPFVALDEKHMAYGSAFGKDHEAGFDSWMTADLFIKLSAKLYSETTAQAFTPDEEFPTPVGEFSRSEPSDNDSRSSSDGYASSDSNGGVPLNPPNTDENFSTTTLLESLPPAWHASQLNPSLTRDSASGTGVIQQWVPGFDSWFWKVYGNQLRVNSVESGVCRLSLVGA
ncbi:hypothetical protein BP6252_12567 [Coleophoma cylindrospora]|uniref:CAF1-domain-containing protein n=1 Tax=Coleophoma cylindrospora TaxID=1849047 RepID=A0A3D8QCV6_9HELO|nr:hypothetical protein BP6252_12567 [Coleophoma cylindrospora]